MKIKLIPIILAILLAAPSSHAEDKDISKAVLMFAGLEGIAIAHSWLLTKSPSGYGTVSGLFYPLVGIESGVDAAYITSVAAAEGMNIYNWKMGEKDISERDVFKRNIIGWHLVFGVTVASNMLFAKSRKSQKIKSQAFSFVTSEYGGELRFEMKF